MKCNYTDGSCLNNPGNGGWAAIINDNGQILKISGSEKNTTNNKMELTAAIQALKFFEKKSTITLITEILIAFFKFSDPSIIAFSFFSERFFISGG